MLSLLFAVLLVLLAVLFFSLHSFYSAQLDSALAPYTMLLTTSLPFWAEFPNRYGTVPTLALSFANCTPRCQPSGQWLTFREFVQLDNLSFSPGNKSTLEYTRWSQLYVEGDPPQSNITTPNFGMQQNYFREKVAPAQRKAPIILNKIIKDLEQSFLPLFYTRTLFAFKFSRPKFRASVYANANLSEKTSSLIEQDPELSMATESGLRSWVTATLLQDSGRQQEGLLTSRFQLTASEYAAMTGEKSVLADLISVVNATIKLKTQSDSLCSDDVCSTRELAMYQWSQSGLSMQQILSGVSLNATSFFQLNRSVGFVPEATQFGQAVGKPGLSLNDASILLNDFSLLEFPNADFAIRYGRFVDLVDSHFGTSDADVYVPYLQYLAAQAEGPLYSSALLGYPLAAQARARLNFLQPFLLSNIVFNKTSNQQCKVLFSKEQICSRFDPKLIQNHRLLVDAALSGPGSDQWKSACDALAVQSDTLRLALSSTIYSSTLLASEGQLASRFKCRSSPCGNEQLASIQWGSASVLSNLPKQYFDKNYSSFTLIDPAFSGEYCKGAGCEQDRKKLSLAYSFDGGFNFFRQLTDPLWQEYLKSVIAFHSGGYFSTGTPLEIAFGYDNPYRTVAATLDPLEGGTPWLSATAYFLNRSEQTTLARGQLDRLGTGIYEPDSLRKVTKKYGLNKTTLEYVFFENEGTRYVQRLDLNSSTLAGYSLQGIPPSLDSGTIWMYDQVLKSQVRFQRPTVQGNTTVFKSPQQLLEGSRFYFNDLEYKVSSGQLVIDSLTGLTLNYSVQVVVSGLVTGQKSEVAWLNRSFQVTLQQQQEMFDQISSLLSARGWSDLFVVIAGGVSLIGLVASLVLRRGKQGQQDSLLLGSSLQ